MKVLPVNFNINSFNPFPVLNDKKSPINKSFSARELPTNYYHPISFGCVDNLETISGQLKRLDNIHCPLCGVKMLNPKEIAPILTEGKELKTGLDFILFVNKYSDNINPAFAKNVKLIKKRCAKFPDAPIKDILKSSFEVAKQNSDEAYQASLERIDNLVKTGVLSTADKKNLTACRKRLEKLPENCNRYTLYKSFTYELRNSINELDTKDKKSVLALINTDVRDCFAVEYLYKPFVGEEPNILNDYVTNLFGGSKSDLRKAFHKFPATLDNTLLSCEHCGSIGKMLRSRDLKPQHYYNYVYEVAQAALDGKLSASPMYPIFLAGNVKKLTASHITPDESVAPLKELMKTLDVKTARTVEFEVADKEGVPCASCGQPTITHERKLELFEAILKANNLQELDNIMTENKEFVVPIYEKIVEEFHTILEQNPNISEDEMFRTLVIHQGNVMKQNVSECIENLKEVADYYCADRHDRALVNEFIATAEKCASFEPMTEFPYPEYRAGLTRLVDNLNSRATRDFWVAAAGTIPKDSSVQWALLSKPDLVQKVGSPMRAFLQNIFKSPTATVDHLKSRKSYREHPPVNVFEQLLMDKKSNLVVMCHDCNSRKKDKALDLWVKNNPEMLENLPKYLTFVRNLRKNNELGADFDLYPFGVLATFKRLTGIDVQLEEGGF